MSTQDDRPADNGAASKGSDQDHGEHNSGSSLVEVCRCDVVLVRTSRADRRRFARAGITVGEYLAAHSDECPRAGAFSTPGWHAAGRARSAFKGGAR